MNFVDFVDWGTCKNLIIQLVMQAVLHLPQTVPSVRVAVVFSSNYIFSFIFLPVSRISAVSDATSHQDWTRIPEVLMRPDRPLSDNAIRLICSTIGITSFILNVFVLVSLLKLRLIYARNIFVILTLLQVRSLHHIRWHSFEDEIVKSWRLERYSSSEEETTIDPITIGFTIR